MWINFVIIVVFIGLAKLLTTRSEWTLKPLASYFLACLLAILFLTLYQSFGRMPDIIQQEYIISHKSEINSAFKLWQEQPDKVAKVLELRLQSNPSDLTARRLLASLYLKQKKYKQAYHVLNSKEFKSTSDPVILIMQAETLQHLGNFAKSLLIMKKIINNKNAGVDSLIVVARLALNANDKELAIHALRLSRTLLVKSGQDATVVDKFIDKLL